MCTINRKNRLFKQSQGLIRNLLYNNKRKRATYDTFLNQTHQLGIFKTKIRNRIECTTFQN